MSSESEKVIKEIKEMDLKVVLTPGEGNVSKLDILVMYKGVVVRTESSIILSR